MILDYSGQVVVSSNFQWITYNGRDMGKGAINRLEGVSGKTDRLTRKKQTGKIVRECMDPLRLDFSAAPHSEGLGPIDAT